MNCRIFRDTILPFVLDVRDERTEEFRRHLDAGCPACTARVAHLEAVLCFLPLSLDPQPLPETMRARLLERCEEIQQLDADRGGRVRPASLRSVLSERSGPAPDSPAAAPTSRRRQLGGLTRWTVAAGLLAAVLLGSTVGYAYVNKTLREQRMVITGLKDKLAHRDQVLLGLDSTWQQVAAVHRAHLNPSLVILTMKAADLGDAAWGRLLWDEAERQWHFFGDMTGANDGKSDLDDDAPGLLHLWVRSADGSPQLLAAFPVATDETVVAHGATVPQLAVDSAFVTLEAERRASPSAPPLIGARDRLRQLLVHLGEGS